MSQALTRLGATAGVSRRASPDPRGARRVKPAVAPGIGVIAALCAFLLAPSAAADQRWDPVGPPVMYRPDDLYGHINGGAELFLEFGFEFLSILRYEAGGAQYTVEMYQMAEPQAALGVYLAKCGKETPDPALGFRHTAGRYQLMMVRNRFFFVISNPAGDEAGAERLKLLARQWSDMLEPDPDRDPLGALPAEGRVAGSERMARGPVALDPVVTLGEGDVLRLARKHTALIARYRDEAGVGYTRLQVTYPDEAAARSALLHLVTNLDSHLQGLEAEQDHLVYRSYDGTYGEATLDGPTLVIRFGLAAPP